MPAASMTARTGPPAITPVPEGAGFSSTRPAEKTPVTSWGMVVPDMATVIMFFLASSMPFANGLRDLSGLAQAETDLALAVTHDHQSGELHDAAAL